MDDKTVWEFGLTYCLNSCEPLPGVLGKTGTGTFLGNWGYFQITFREQRKS